MDRRFAVLLSVCLGSLPQLSQAQTLLSLTNPAPEGAGLALQLTDGTVLVQGAGADWFKLTPDITGSYVNGTWTQVASLPSGYSPSYFASAVLADGRVAIIGGEYNFGKFAFTNLGAIYDPVANTWTKLGHPEGWGFIGDSPSVVLPDGRFVVGEKMHKNLAALNPKTLQWTELSDAGKNDWNAEEGWTLLSDGTFLTADVLDHPKSERYDPTQGQWLSAGNTKADLWGPPCCQCIPYGNHGKCYLPPGEIGPAILRPDGTVFATGASNHTSIYRRPDARHPKGTWTPGPDMPVGSTAGDTFASLLPDGNVLLSVDLTELFEFDGKQLINENIKLSVEGLLMVLPTGQVLVSGDWVYESSGTYQPGWQPTVTSYPSTVARGSTYQISGTQFNGLSQANAFGDEEQQATNYPLVRITNNATSHVFYARTHDHSTMGVATGSAAVSTNFDVPSGMETGASSLVVVANGIPSAPVALTVQ